MNDFQAKKKQFLDLYEQSRPISSALGDETRQLIVKTMIEHSGNGGLRVGEIQKNTHTSRTAVSHHLKILKDAGIIDMRKEGTKNFYFINSESSSLHHLISFWKEAEIMMELCPERNKHL